MKSNVRVSATSTTISRDFLTSCLISMPRMCFCCKYCGHGPRQGFGKYIHRWSGALNSAKFVRGSISISTGAGVWPVNEHMGHCQGGYCTRKGPQGTTLWRFRSPPCMPSAHVRWVQRQVQPTFVYPVRVVSNNQQVKTGKGRRRASKVSWIRRGGFLFCVVEISDRRDLLVAWTVLFSNMGKKRVLVGYGIDVDAVSGW